jgi:hypothetical protein
MANCGFNFDAEISEGMNYEEREKIISKTRLVQV